MERLASCLTEFGWSRILPNDVPIFHAGRPVLLYADADVWVAQIRFLSPTPRQLGGFTFCDWCPPGLQAAAIMTVPVSG
jgi:hypothetical protein